jgi:glycerate kinase
MIALASPASLKGVLTPLEAAVALAAGLRRVEGVEVDEAPVADGGEGTAMVLERSLGGDWHEAAVGDPLGRRVTARWLRLPDGTGVVECAAAVGLPRLRPDELDPLHASSEGVGELILAALEHGIESLLVGVGGVATVDGGVGMRAVVGDALHDVTVRVACDVRNPLLGERGAARVFGPQKGADEEAVVELEGRLASVAELEPYRDVPGAGAGGGLGAAFAALGGELLPGAELVLDRIGFDERAARAALVVTGEGTVDATTLEGKAPGAVVERCRRLGVRCALFGGLVRDGVQAHALSGDRGKARDDIERLGQQLAEKVSDTL